MKILGNDLHIEFSELLDCSIPERTLEAWKEPVKIPDPSDKRRKLYNFELLKDKYKIMIRARYGNPYEFVAKDPIKKLVRKDYKAEEFFECYRFDNGSPLPKLPKNYVQEYTDAASWLNMIAEILADKRVLKRQLHITIEQFWKNVCELISAYKIDLPASDRNLRMKVKEYKAQGYQCIISKRFGNNNSMKVGKTVEGTVEPEVAQKQIALIRKAASLHQNFTPEEIAINVNPIFHKNGWSTLSRATISNIVNANKHIVTSGRSGIRAFNSTIARQVIRERPAFPLQYVTLDGWTVELLYQDETGYDNRMVAVVVLDTMNNYPLGYAIGERENIELIREACRNAILHAKELFGKDFRPWQIQSDHYGLKTLTPFYEAIAHLSTPAAVGNAKSKVIEPYFKDLNKGYCKYQQNWSGFGITARKENQPNSEYLNKIKHSFPDKKGVVFQITKILERERQIKQQEYVQKWNEVPASLLPPSLNEQQQIIVFGQQTGYLNTITGKGLLPTIDGHKIAYDSFDPAFRANQHLKWRITYLPDNLQKIVATSEDGKSSFLLEQSRSIGMGIKNHKDGDVAYMTQIKQFNKDRVQEIIEVYTQDAALVDEVIARTPLSLTDPEEARIKLMFTHKGQQKERIQDAKRLGKAKALSAKQSHQQVVAENNAHLNAQIEYFESKVDFNQYKD